METIKVLVVDDHPMVLEGMRSMLSQLHFVEIVGTAENAYTAMELVKSASPHLIITDINMPEISGMDLALKIKKEFPDIKIIAMSTFKERSYISQMIQNGATGYLVKSASKAEIEEAILSVYEGKLYMSLDMNLSATDKQELYHVPVLSSREKQVLQLIGDGMTNPQIAAQLFISLHTVDSHRKNLLTKFSVNNTAGLIRQATRFNFLS